MSRLDELLREVDVPDADAARERGWRIVRAAYDSRPRDARARVARRRPRPVLVGAAVALLVVVVVLALTPPGGAVADWVRDRIAADKPPAHLPARPVLDSLPGRGRLLVMSRSGPWVVGADGSRRLLGPYLDATWSPAGLFVAVTRRDALLAVAPNGTLRWAIDRPAVSRPRWSPSGYRVAYHSGSSLRVVAGDGTGDHPLARFVGPAAAAWRPAWPAHVLAYAGRRGWVAVVDADTRRELWRSDAAQAPRALAWSADGRRLLALASHEWRLFSASGRLLERRRLPYETVAISAAFARGGHRFAVALERRGVAEVVLAGGDRRGDRLAFRGAGRRERLVFRGGGRFGDVAWSPDGRWLAIDWPSADEWLFVRVTPARPAAARRFRAIDGVARRFDPRGRTPAAPRIAGWCCAR